MSKSVYQKIDGSRRETMKEGKMSTSTTPATLDAGERNRATGQAESAVTQSQPVPQTSSRSQPWRSTIRLESGRQKIPQVLDNGRGDPLSVICKFPCGH